MVNDPIERLLQEHRSILRVVAGLREAVGALESRGEAALPAALPALRAAAHLMDGELVSHARREDEALFPALERELGADDGPTGVMREEHRAIHARGALLRSTLDELERVQHPALMRSGAELGSLAADGADAAALRATGREFLSLIEDHFAKEEQILFPMAREVLDPATMAEVARRMEELDAG